MSNNHSTHGNQAKVISKPCRNALLFIVFTLASISDAYNGNLSSSLQVKSSVLYNRSRIYTKRNECKDYQFISYPSIQNNFKKTFNFAEKSSSSFDISKYRTGNESDAKDSSFLRTLNEKIERNKKFIKKYKQKLKRFNEEEVILLSTRNKYLKGSQLGKLQSEESFHETALRSAIKSIAWRIVAGSVTFFTSLSFSRNLSTAIQIVGLDFFSKAFTMFLGERLMNKSQLGRKGGSECARRSFLKALLWRLFAICNTMALSLFFSQDIEIASKIAGSDAILKTMMMFLYERFWNDIRWGKDYLIELSI